MRKILFPTDFSETSLNAYLYALHLAKKLDAEVITLHVFDYPMEHLVENYDYFLLEIYQVKEWGDFENFKSEVPRLRAIAEKAQLGHVRVSHMLERGDPVTEILRVITAEKPDFVVMGTKGASGLKKVFLGTVAEHIMNRANTMVLAIPAKCSYKPIRHILYLMQFENYQMDLLHKVHNFAMRFNAHILAMQIKNNHDNRETIILSRWKEHFKENTISFEVMATEDTEQAINDIITAQKIDMVALHVHQKGLFEKVFGYSLARELAFDATVPLLSIPV